MRLARAPPALPRPGRTEPSASPERGRQLLQGRYAVRAVVDELARVAPAPVRTRFCPSLQAATSGRGLAIGWHSAEPENAPPDPYAKCRSIDSSAFKLSASR